ncbi:hypothetical protein BDR22DRAFT_889703 [Usnea florida]
MFLSKTTPWLLFFALLCWECALGAHLPHGSLIERSSVGKPQNQPEPRANAISAKPGTVLVPPTNPARSVGIHIHPLTRPILPQAVGQCIIQAMYTVFVDFGQSPSAASNSFHHSVSSRVPNFNVQLEISPTTPRLTGEYVFTNTRVAETLSLLGFEYSNQQNTSSMVEYTFDVVIDVWQAPEVIIARGSVMNIQEPDSPEASITPRMRK